MDSQKILYSPGGNDERYTPAYAITPLLKYIPKNKKIWCPFDTNESNYVKVFENAGYNVVCSHINYGQDFFTYEPESWDIIISNPPFTNKRKFFERAIALEKPFALLMTNTRLNDAAPKIIFKEAGIDLQLMMFDKRVEFIRPEGESPKKITFSSSYYCHGILPKQIVIEYLQK